MTASLRPIDLARAAGLSSQMVRKYERWGFIPLSERSAGGHRQYTARHLEAMVTARAMIAGYGWMPALRIMRQVHGGDLSGAAAAVDGRHALLDQERRHLEQTLAALNLLAEGAVGRHRDRSRLLVGDVARRAGVQVSALRFWEQQGLLEPERDLSSGYRVYAEEQAVRAEVIALLRRAGYSVEGLRPVLEDLAAGNPERAIGLARERMQELARASRRCMAATAALHAYLEGMPRGEDSPSANGAPTQS